MATFLQMTFFILFFKKKLFVCIVMKISVEFEADRKWMRILDNIFKYILNENRSILIGI